MKFPTEVEILQDKIKDLEKEVEKLQAQLDDFLIFDSFQLEQILLGVKEGLDVSVYANPEYGSKEMAIMREDLKQGIKINLYADPKAEGYKRYKIWGVRKKVLQDSLKIKE